jgi:hypothetical protein
MPDKQSTIYGITVCSKKFNSSFCAVNYPLSLAEVAIEVFNNKKQTLLMNIFNLV